MKPTTLIVSTAVALLLAGGVYRALAPAKQTRPMAVSPKSEVSAPAPSATLSSHSAPLPASHPATFAGLPLNANGDQYAERIHALDRNVPEQEQAALAAWMNGPKPARFSAAVWLYLDNEVMDKLCHQTRPFAEWSALLIAIVRNKANDSGLRDYAIQHLVDRLQPVGLGDPCETATAAREAIVATMRDAAGETTEDLAGTAVQALNISLQNRQCVEARHEPAARLSFPFSVEALRPLAVKLSTAPETTDAARMTALQVCAQRGFDEVLPLARTIAADTKRRATLRLSAIAVIGQLGNAGDQAILNAVQNERNPRLLKAVQPALNKLQQRAAAATRLTKQ